MEAHTSDDELIAWALRARWGEQARPAWPPRRGAYCPVGLAPLQAGDVAVRLPCGHVLRAECIFPYLRAHARGQPRHCPLDGVEVPAALSATRMRVVGPYDAQRDRVEEDADVSDDACLRWMDVALREAEAAIGAEHGDQSLYLAMRSASLLTRRNNYLARFSSPTVPPEEAIASSYEIAPVCDNADCCASTLASGDTLVTSLPCAHWLCAACDTPRRLRCAACSALRPDGARAVRWSLNEAFRRENLRIRCGELAMQRVEREVEPYSRDMAEIHRRYATVSAMTASGADDVAYHFNALMERFRDALANPPTPSDEVVLPSPRPEAIAVPAVPPAPDAGSWTPPSPGGSPGEGMSNLIVGLRQLLIRAPAPGPPAREEVAGTSPVSEDDTHICVVCLCEIERGERAIRLSCCHLFHADCILQYLRTAPRPQCPLDRIDVPRRVIDTLPVFKWGDPEAADAD